MIPLDGPPEVDADLRAASEPRASTTGTDRARRARSTSISVILADGQAALAVPAFVMTTLPSFRREVVAHLVLDQSGCAATNRAAMIARAKAALEALPPSISKFHLTWANYEQVDLPGEPLSREEAVRALNHVPTLPHRGGFCPERVITRVLLSGSGIPHTPQPAGFAPLFVAIPAPGSIPMQGGGLAPFTRLIPDLPAYVLFDTNGFKRVSFHSTAQSPFLASDFIPADSVAIRNGATTTLVEANRDALVFAPASSSSGWQVWNPASSQFDPLSAPTPCVDPAYGAGLSLWSRHRSLAWTPGKLDAALPDLVNDTRATGLLIPEAAFIVLETQS